MQPIKAKKARKEGTNMPIKTQQRMDQHADKKYAAMKYEVRGMGVCIPIPIPINPPCPRPPAGPNCPKPEARCWSQIFWNLLALRYQFRNIQPWNEKEEKFAIAMTGHTDL